MSLMKNILKGLSKLTATYKQPYPDIHMLDFKMVNVFIVSNVQMRKYDWVIVDAGIHNSGKTIIRTGEKLFGVLGAPRAVILTQGRYDHSGGISQILSRWDVPVYIHADEIPYVTGEKIYLPVKGETESEDASFPIENYENIAVLPEGGYVPCMPEWKWIHTPGPSDGHISLFRESDKVLIPGDVFTNPKQNSFFSIITKKNQIKEALAYLTPEWEKYKNSVIALKNLNPKFALPSHGAPLQGKALTKHLDLLLADFQEMAVHKQYGDEISP